MRNSVPKNQIRALAMALAGAIVAAVGTMLVPVAILESIAGSSGLSELVPAARAPLGDTARALIAFGAGAFTLALLAYILLRQDSITDPAVSERAPANDAPSLMDRLAKITLPAIAMPKMPWAKGEHDITELADLPKLRNGDSHPDAPPRRPLVASQDLPVLDLVELPQAATSPKAHVSDAIIATEPMVPEAITEMPVAAQPMSVSQLAPTLAEMVEQLESAVAERQKQLAELEAVATELAASRPALHTAVAEHPGHRSAMLAEQDDKNMPAFRSVRPTVEAVPTTPVKDDDMDSALAAALATLHRMNATGG